ncbi:hypothetical protein F511_03385 [Dorcoceras hygrometricum]|uniref:Uncharacterized protein n=1 Tax=Dorcoceras hygrometricum TaxID=472368 RepID=A0A2Z7BI62_9LAMI|nr:hypothetical protein F511_03385 [Dorcoceras hygrometricum]
MPPRRGGGRRTRRSEEESRAGSDDDDQVEDVTRQIGGMELVLARFQRTNPPTLAAERMDKAALLRVLHERPEEGSSGAVAPEVVKVVKKRKTPSSFEKEVRCQKKKGTSTFEAKTTPSTEIRRALKPTAPTREERLASTPPDAYQDNSRAQFRANGYSDEEHPASFLSVARDLEELPDDEEEEVDDGISGDEDTPPSFPAQYFEFPIVL